MDVLTAAVYDEVVDSRRGAVEQVDGDPVGVDYPEVVQGRIAVVDGDPVLSIGDGEVLDLGAQTVAAGVEHDAVVISRDGLKQYWRCRRALHGESSGHEYGLVVAELDGGSRLYHEYVPALDRVAVLQHHGS